MGLAKFIHEWLVISLATLLSNLYQNKNYFVLGSNLGIKTYDSPAHPATTPMLLLRLTHLFFGKIPRPSLPIHIWL